MPHIAFLLYYNIYVYKCYNKLVFKIKFLLAKKFYSDIITVIEQQTRKSGLDLRVIFLQKRRTNL